MRLRGLDDVTKENDNLHSSKALSQTLALKHHGFFKAGLYPPERPLVQVTKLRLLFIFVAEYHYYIVLKSSVSCHCLKTLSFAL